MTPTHHPAAPAADAESAVLAWLLDLMTRLDWRHAT
jgi:hypothetical protein